MVTLSRTARGRAGLSLVEVLVVVVILLLLGGFLLTRMTGGEKDFAEKKVAAPRQRAQQTVGASYVTQINQAISMYRMDNDNRNPPDLQALKTYGVTDEMLIDPVTRQPLAYDPRTGTVGSSPGTSLPRVPGF